MNRSPVGQKTKGVLENATSMEQGQGDAHDALQPFLYPPEPGSFWVFYLIINFILSEGKNWHQVSSKTCLQQRQMKISLFYIIFLF